MVGGSTPVATPEKLTHLELHELHVAESLALQGCAPHRRFQAQGGVPLRLLPGLDFAAPVQLHLL